MDIHVLDDDQKGAGKVFDEIVYVFSNKVTPDFHSLELFSNNTPFEVNDLNTFWDLGEILASL